MASTYLGDLREYPERLEDLLIQVGKITPSGEDREALLSAVGNSLLSMGATLTAEAEEDSGSEWAAQEANL